MKESCAGKEKEPFFFVVSIFFVVVGRVECELESRSSLTDTKAGHHPKFVARPSVACSALDNGAAAAAPPIDLKTTLSSHQPHRMRLTFPYVCGGGFFFFTLSHAKLHKNVLLLIADDMRPQLNETYGQPWMYTPHLDMLAKESLVFDAAYANFAICAASTSSSLSPPMPCLHQVAIPSSPAVCPIKHAPGILLTISAAPA